MTDTRRKWLDAMLKIASPVIEACADGRLRERMPIYARPEVHDREEYTYLEALGRTICGIAPWLSHPAEDDDEEALRAKYAELTRRAIKSAVMPGSQDLMNFSSGGQPIVDAAFLCEGLLRAPEELYHKLDEDTKCELLARLRETRTRKPYASNWLLFSATIEAFIYCAGARDWDPMRIDYALRQHEQWYLGDGFYGDGPEFHLDWYNSYVINPMMVDVTRAMTGVSGDWDEIGNRAVWRAARFASAQESMIACDGTYPVLGRSSAYRFGAFHALAQSVLLGYLPESVSPASVRCALTAVLERVMSYVRMFDKDGWLTIGVAGCQPDIGEGYISTGSLYLCTFMFLPLGRPESSDFWQLPDAKWTQKRIWDGDGDAVTRH